MNKIKTIVFGGSFNPPTLAHESILSACVDFSKKWNADVWILPSGDRMDKEISSPRSVRLDYISAMIDDIDTNGVNVSVVTSELDRNKVVETIDTVHEFNQSHPDRDFIWVFGADSIINMMTWRGGEWMLNNLKMIGVEREGLDCPKRQNITITKTHFPHISSTELRRKLQVNEPINGMVGIKVNKLLTK
jgi:nicotinate-nucleotide adenylyltransferase